MNNKKPRPQRRSIRLKEFDYSQTGAYFVTICIQERLCLFGQIVGQDMELNDAGRMVETVWNRLPERFPDLILDSFVMMPNHIHGILILSGDRRGESCIRPKQRNTVPTTPAGDHKDRPYKNDRARGTSENSVGRIVQAFKSITTHEYIKDVKQHNWPAFPKKLWQRNYYEHAIRNDDDLNQTRRYILENPMRWTLDENNPQNTPQGD